MALGKPAVPFVKEPSVRSIEGALTAVRERLRQIDIAVAALNSASSTSLSNTVAALQANIQALNRRVTQLELQVGVTDVVVLTAAEAIGIGDAIVMLGVATCGVVNPADPIRVHACIGVAQGAAAAGQSVNVQRRGSFTIPTGVLEPGRAVYAKLGGGLTQLPGYAAYAVPVGIATSTTTLWVQPADPSLLEPDTYTSEYDLPVPVSYALLQNQLGALTALIDLLNMGADGYVVIYQGAFGVTSGGGGGGGSISDGTYGQIIVSSAGTVWTITAGSVTLAQMASLPAGTIIGNDSGAPATPQALTPAEVKALLAIDSSDIADFFDSVLAALYYSLVAGDNITITPNSAGALVIAAASGTSWTNSSSAPGSPADGDEWFDPDTGVLYRYVNDGTSSQWVEL